MDRLAAFPCDSATITVICKNKYLGVCFVLADPDGNRFCVVRT